MIYELIVTSVPRGLQAGRSGFTTVLRTRGIHPQVAETLERASGYRHVFPHGDSRNPQIRSHTVVTGATGVVSVLSRIVDAGSDYSGRSNKLAHHLALDSGETAARAKSNPAVVFLALERSGGFQRQWSGDPREQPAAPAVPVMGSEPGVCQAWARLAGDAGWAGLLVDRALAKQPTWIIAPQGLDLLELFAEALGLVNYPQRWGVTFTTYALSAGDGLWLGTVDGSPEAQAARGQSRLAVVDLVRRAPLTSTSPTIEAARGTAPVPWKREAMRPAAAAPLVESLYAPSTAGTATAVPAAGAPRGGPAMPPTYVPGGPPTLNGAPPPLVPGGPLGAPAVGDNLLLPGGMAEPARGRRRIGGLLAVVVAMLLIAVVGGGVVVVLTRAQQLRQTAGKDGVEPKDSGPKDSGKAIAKGDGEPEASKPAQAEMGPVATPAVPSPEEVAAAAERQKADAAAREVEAGNAARLQAFRDLKARLEDDGHLPLKADVNLENEQEQSLTLCDLGSAEVDVSLPTVGRYQTPDRDQWLITLEGSSRGPWPIGVRLQKNANDKPTEIGEVKVQELDGKQVLSLRLLKMPAVRDPVWVAGRQALTTAPLLLRLPGSQASADTETFVQLCTPKQLAPLTFEKLLTDKKWLPKGQKLLEPLESYPLPDTPWPCRVELEGHGRDGISAVVTATAITDEKQRARIAAQPQPDPLEVTARWIWSGSAQEPFMETTLSLQNRLVAPGLGGRGAFEAQVTGSKVLPKWAGWQRLGDLSPPGAKAKEPPDVLPTAIPAFFKNQLPEKTDGKSEPEYAQGMLVIYAEMARHYVKKFDAKLIGSLLAQGQAQVKKQPMSAWQTSMRDLLKSLPNYQKWVTKKAPDPGPKPGDKDPKLAQWQTANQKHVKYAAAGPEVVREFWDELKDNEGRHEAEVGELVLCCLHFELEPVLAEKRLTKRLLEAVGDGTVTLTGKVWADATETGIYKVLLAEFAAKGDSDAGKQGGSASPPKKDATPDSEAVGQADPPNQSSANP